MHKQLGIICIALGIICLMASAGLVMYNHLEAKSAEEASAAMLHDIRPRMKEKEQKVSQAVIQDDVVQNIEDSNILKEMPIVQLDGYDCIGILSIPVLELELPVLHDWDYQKLKLAPCQYYGSCYAENFVIAGHNYSAHFGRLSQLLPEDLILFTDVLGETHYYEVVLLETLSATATESMLTSGFDLSLYTCTPGGANRITVRCQSVSEGYFGSDSGSE